MTPNCTSLANPHGTTRLFSLISTELSPIPTGKRRCGGYPGLARNRATRSPRTRTRTRVMPCCPIVSISTWRKCASDELGLPQSRPVNLPPQMIFPFISSVVSHASDRHIVFVDLCEALTSDMRFDIRGSPPPCPKMGFARSNPGKCRICPSSAMAVGTSRPASTLVRQSTLASSATSVLCARWRTT